jgi:Uma2 family endonuclease
MTLPASPGPTPGTSIADWLAQPEEARLELIDGVLLAKAAPSFDHGRAQLVLGSRLGDQYDRRPGDPRGPGGWRIGSEIDVVMDGRGYRPDLVGWRRDTLPGPPRARPVTARPDWICEIVSESNRATDTVTKVRRYHQAGLPHYWMLDQVERTLTVLRHVPEGYVIALRAEASERVRAEPFGELELNVGELLGDEP